MNRKIIGIAYAMLVCGMLTGCGGSEASYATTSTASESLSTTASSTDTSSAESTQTEPVIATEQADPPEEDTAELSAENHCETAEPQSRTSEAVLPTEEADVTAEAPKEPVTTSEAAKTEPAETTSAASTKATTATTEKKEPPKPVEVVIPDIELPLSAGVDVLTGDYGTIDYSNCHDGYISVTYKGSAPKVKLRIVYGDNTYNHDVPTDGSTEYYPLSCGSGDYTVGLYENVEGKLYANAVEQVISADITDETGVFLFTNRYVKFGQNSRCVKKAAELCAGLTTPIDRIGAMFLYVAENTSYDRELAANPPTGYVPHPDSTLKSGKGICYDYASLFAAMARSQGIPTRLCIGYASPDIYHAWNEVYTKETGWITPELFLKQKGYNLVDATFYSGAKDKAQISEYISDKSNYSVIYYY